MTSTFIVFSRLPSFENQLTGEDCSSDHPPCPLCQTLTPPPVHDSNVLYINVLYCIVSLMADHFSATFDDVRIEVRQLFEE